MASEKVKLFSKLELEVIASAQGTLSLLTDLPGDAMKQRFSFSVPASTPGTNGVLLRRTVRSRLPYNTQGHLIQAILTPGGGQTILYRARVWARELPGGDWQWYALPVIETPVEFQPMDLPVPPTVESWSDQPLPIPPTGNDWNPLPLPIPGTPDNWNNQELPIKPTPDVPDWADLEVDR